MTAPLPAEITAYVAELRNAASLFGDPRLIDAAEFIERMAEAQGWRPVQDMPRDGRWIIAVCNDGVTVHRISWGRARNGDLCWCEADRALYYGYGDDASGLFAGWIECPQPKARPMKEPL